MSDRGAIICSANASNNGIGFVDLAELVEAGIFVDPDDAAFADAADWFEHMWRRAQIVDSPTLDQAATAWNSRSQSRGRPNLAIPKGAPSLLAAVAADPERYRGISFVFTNGRATKEEREGASNALIRQDHERSTRLLSHADRQQLRTWPLGDLLTQCSEQDLDA